MAATWLVQNTATAIALGPFVDATDLVTPETGLTIAQADVRLKKGGGNWAQKNESSACTHEENGWYECALNATDTNTLGPLVVAVNVAGAAPVWREFEVVSAATAASAGTGTNYCTLAALKAHLGIAVADTDDDTSLETLIGDVSRWFDRETGRRFYTTTNAETRYYTARSRERLLLRDDLLSVTTLATDDGSRAYATAWAATDYDLEPVNEARYWEICATPQGDYSFPTNVSRGVKLVGQFGYCAIGDLPGDLARAVLIRCGQIWALGPAAFNAVGGAGAESSIPAAWPVVRDTIELYKARWGVG